MKKLLKTWKNGLEALGYSSVTTEPDGYGLLFRRRGEAYQVLPGDNCVAVMRLEPVDLESPTDVLEALIIANGINATNWVAKMIVLENARVVFYAVLPGSIDSVLSVFDQALDAIDSSLVHYGEHLVRIASEAGIDFELVPIDADGPPKDEGEIAEEVPAEEPQPTPRKRGRPRKNPTE